MFVDLGSLDSGIIQQFILQFIVLADVTWAVVLANKNKWIGKVLQAQAKH